METKVLVVDDHDIICFGLASLLTQNPEYRIIGQACNGIEALKIVKQKHPDLVIMDLGMPKMNGLEATRAIKACFPQAEIIIQSTQDSGKYVLDCLNAGAKGVVLTSTLVRDLIPAVKTALRGETYVSKELTDHFEQPSSFSWNSFYPSLPKLSPRERQVLQLLAEGKRSEDIGIILHLCKNTVVSHRQNIMNKLQLRSVAQLTKYAIREGLTSLDY